MAGFKPTQRSFTESWHYCFLIYALILLQTALSAGIDFITKDLAIIMDGDLQDPHELIPKFIEKINENYNVVYAIRKNRKENFLKRINYFFSTDY